MCTLLSLKSTTKQINNYSPSLPIYMLSRCVATSGDYIEQTIVLIQA